WDQIGKLCKSLETPPGTMNTFNLKSGAQIVDDTYNANPKGFLAALDFLGDFKKSHKVVITSGIIELGSYSHLVHKDLGNLMAKNCDLVILTDVDFAEDIASGLGGQKEKLLVI